MSEENLKPEESGRSLQCLTGFFESREWQYRLVPNQPAVELPFTGENARWQCKAIAGDGSPLIFLSLLPCRVPVNRRSQVADLFARINWGLTSGCFELNLDSGEVRFRTSQPMPSAEINPDFIEGLVFSNAWAVDHFFGAIMSVVYTRTTPRAALATLEAASKPSVPKAPKPDQQTRFNLN